MCWHILQSLFDWDSRIGYLYNFFKTCLTARGFRNCHFNHPDSALTKRIIQTNSCTMCMRENDVTIWLTIGGKRAIPLIWRKCTDGYIFTLGFKIDRDIHLTTLEKDERINWHVKDNQLQKPPYGAQFKPSKIIRTIEKHAKKWIVRYHGNQKAWQMTPKLMAKINSLLQIRTTKKTIEYPMEIDRAEIELDFQDRTRWKRVKIRDLLNKENAVAVLFIKGHPYFIRVIDKNHLVALSKRRFSSLLHEMATVLGYEDFFEYYLTTIEPKTIEVEVAKRLRDGQ